MPKGIRKGKSPEKITTHLATPDQYDYYKDNNFKSKDSSYYITRTQYTAFLKLFFDRIIDKIIYENYEFKIPSRLGKMYIRKYSSKPRLDENGKLVANLPIDWNSTIKLWNKDKEARDKKILVKHLNKHSDGYVYKFYFIRGTSSVKNRYMWWFKPTRQNKLKLKSAITKGTVNFFEIK